MPDYSLRFRGTRLTPFVTDWTQVPYFPLALTQKLAGQYHALLEEVPTVLAFLCILELHLNRKTNITTI